MSINEAASAQNITRDLYSINGAYGGKRVANSLHTCLGKLLHDAV